MDFQQFYLILSDLLTMITLKGGFKLEDLILSYTAMIHLTALIFESEGRLSKCLGLISQLMNYWVEMED